MDFLLAIQQPSLPSPEYPRAIQMAGDNKSPDAPWTLPRQSWGDRRLVKQHWVGLVFFSANYLLLSRWIKKLKSLYLPSPPLAQQQQGKKAGTGVYFFLVIMSDPLSVAGGVARLLALAEIVIRRVIQYRENIKKTSRTREIRDYELSALRNLGSVLDISLSGTEFQTLEQVKDTLYRLLTLTRVDCGNEGRILLRFHTPLPDNKQPTLRPLTI
jgi:hypothetical protein